MVKRKKTMEIDFDLHCGYKNLQKRYNRPMKEIAKTIFDTTDLQTLDQIFQGRQKTIKKSKKL